MMFWENSIGEIEVSSHMTQDVEWKPKSPIVSLCQHILPKYYQKSKMMMQSDRQSESMQKERKKEKKTKDLKIKKTNQYFLPEIGSIVIQ